MEEPRLPSPIDPHTFPAKLWRLVNSPRCCSVRWDARGEGLLIDQALFERELLGAGPGLAAGPGGDGAEVFKTKNFSSLVRQLNLYGFRKVMAGPAGSGAGAGAGPGPKGDCGAGGSSSGPLHHFHSPHFHRGRPDLLTQMKRLTRANRAKLAAGLQASSRPATRIQRLMGSALSPDLLPKANGLGYEVPTATGIGVPLPRRCCTTVTYTVRPVSSILPLEQWSSSTAPCRSPPSTSSGSPGLASSTSSPCSSVQTPPVQSSCTADVPPCDAPEAEVNLEELFQMIEEKCAPIIDEIMKGESQTFLTADHADNTKGTCAAVTEEGQFPPGRQLIYTLGEEGDSPVTPTCRKRRHSSRDDNSPDLQGGAACKRGRFQEEASSK
ncbi:heat shock factor protein 5-like [Heliangelus exortis]|uniref:heat shock factor protein 5-like n=1 Tax=Heliangelus exortis TaxID=472823 RepID=UPI003A945AA4